MKLKHFYKGLSIVAMAFGAILIVNTQIPIAGAVIANNAISINATILWAAFFIITGVALFYAQSRDSKK